MTDLIHAVDVVVTEWVREVGGRVERREPGLWVLRAADDLNDGTISVSLRPNEHGPITVAPSNAPGWFELLGGKPEGLRALLDHSLARLREWVGREDPGQGMS